MNIVNTWQILEYEAKKKLRAWEIFFSTGFLRTDGQRLWAVGSDAGAAFDLWRLSAAPPGGGRTAGLVSLEALEAVQREADFAQRAGAYDCWL